MNAIKKAAEQEAQALKNVNDAAIRNAKENAERDLAKLKEDGERAKEAARQAKLVEEQEKERAAQVCRLFLIQGCIYRHKLMSRPAHWLILCYNKQKSWLRKN